MKISRVAIAVSLLLTLMVAGRSSAPAADAQAVKDEQARLEGAWAFAVVKVSGREQPIMGGQLADRLIYLKDGRFTVVQGPGITHGTYKVDPGHKPKLYDVHIATGRFQGVVVPGIYAIDGDTLTMCLPLRGAQRPTALETRPGDGLLLEVFKRQHENVKDVLIAAGRRELTGTWQSVSYALDGKKASDDDMKKIQLVFDAEGNTKALNDGKLFLASTTKIDPTANPASIDITFTGGEGKGTALGIYKIEDGVLTICRSAPGKPRPTEFASEPGSGLTLMSYRHEAADKSTGRRPFRAKASAQ